ncbi:hypothetical protein E2C01_058217 [Portunus trituberculatus]|uniref:Uncharacterized protein n=1 Tax=Portunus trituberculatus TaxID=210409 RepID=A0A5B7H2L4_PORTR|nr:hypothetical protein [Portunus trituberculatus]
MRWPACSRSSGVPILDSTVGKCAPRQEQQQQQKQRAQAGVLAWRECSSVVLHRRRSLPWDEKTPPSYHHPNEESEWRDTSIFTYLSILS